MRPLPGPPGPRQGLRFLCPEEMRASLWALFLPFTLYLVLKISLPWSHIPSPGCVCTWIHIQCHVYVPPLTLPLISDLADTRGP